MAVQLLMVSAQFAPQRCSGSARLHSPAQRQHPNRLLWELALGVAGIVLGLPTVILAIMFVLLTQMSATSFPPGGYLSG